MSGSGSGSNANPANDSLAQISRDQYDLVQKYAQPEVQALLKNLDTGTFQGQIDKSGQQAGQAFDTAVGSTARNAQRYGISLDPTQKANVNRHLALSKSLGISKAQNDTRSAISDRRDQAIQGLMGLGRGFSSSANAGLSNVSGLTSQRNSANAQSMGPVASFFTSL